MRARRDSHYTLLSLRKSGSHHHPDIELEGSARSVVQLEGLLLESTPGITYAPGDLHGQITVVFNCYALRGPSFRGCAPYVLLQQGSARRGGYLPESIH